MVPPMNPSTNPISANVGAVSRSRTPGSRAIRGPWPRAQGAEQHRNPLAVVGGELLDDPVGQGVVPAHDQVIPVLGQTAGHRGHGEI